MGVFWRPAARGSFEMRNCVVEGRVGMTTMATAEIANPEPARMVIANNTFAITRALQIMADNQPKQPLRVESRDNLFAIEEFAVVMPMRRPRRFDGQLPTPIVISMLQSFVSEWTEEGNVYQSGTRYLTHAPLPRTGSTISAGVDGVAKWLEFWSLDAGAAIEGKIRFHERSGPAASEPLLLVGVEEASGSVASAVGATAESVGPGVAYDQWRRSSEYESWPAKSR